MLLYTFALSTGVSFTVVLKNTHYKDAVESLQFYEVPLVHRCARGEATWQGGYTKTMQMLELVELRPTLAEALVEGMQFMRELFPDDYPLTMDWLRKMVTSSCFHMELEPAAISYDITPQGFVLRQRPVKNTTAFKRPKWKGKEHSSWLKVLTGRVKVPSALR